VEKPSVHNAKISPKNSLPLPINYKKNISLELMTQITIFIPSQNRSNGTSASGAVGMGF